MALVAASGTPQATFGRMTAMKLQQGLLHTAETDLRLVAIMRWCCEGLDRRCTRAEATEAIVGLAERCMDQIPGEAA